MAIQIQSPCFVPRVLHNDHSYVAYRHYEMLNFAANFFHITTPQIQSLLNSISSQTKYLAIDPRTPIFQFGGHSKKKPTYSMLQYAIPLNTTLSTQSFNKQYTVLFTGQVINEQRQHGTNIIIPPYFYFSGNDDPWFTVNINCVAEASKQRTSNENILMFVLFDCALLLRPQSISTVSQHLTSCNVDGYYLMAADLDPLAISPALIKGYQNLVSQLAQTGRPVIVAQAGKLGLALIAHGAAGYAMGFGKLDSLALETFGEKGGGPGQPNRYYFHNLLLPVLTRKSDNIANVQATSPAYPCSCTHCQGRLPTQIPSKERTYHYIDFRLAELAALNGLNRTQIRTHLRNLFNQAYNLSLTTHLELSQQQPFSGNTLKSSEFAHLGVIAQCL
jgi:hypothetical protein